jgi:hypothetical protein
MSSGSAIIADEESFDKEKSAFKVLKLIFFLAIEIMKLLDNFSINWGEVNDQQKRKSVWLV